MFFDLCVPINYKIKFLEAQVLKSYRIFIQQSYRGWAFSLPPSPPHPSFIQNRVNVTIDLMSIIHGTIEGPLFNIKTVLNFCVSFCFLSPLIRPRNFHLCNFSPFSPYVFLIIG